MGSRIYRCRFRRTQGSVLRSYLAYSLIVLSVTDRELKTDEVDGNFMNTGDLSYNVQDVAAGQLQRELPRVDEFSVFDQEIMLLEETT